MARILNPGGWDVPDTDPGPGPWSKFGVRLALGVAAGEQLTRYALSDGRQVIARKATDDFLGLGVNWRAGALTGHVVLGTALLLEAADQVEW